MIDRDLRRALLFIAPYWRRLVLVLVLSALSTALSLYLRTAVFVAPVVPVVAFGVSYVSAWVGLVLIVGLNLLGLLPLESHQPPAGVERGPRPVSSRPRRRGSR